MRQTVDFVESPPIAHSGTLVASYSIVVGGFVSHLNLSYAKPIGTLAVISKEELEGAKDALRAIRNNTVVDFTAKLSKRYSQCESGDVYSCGVFSILRDVEKEGLAAGREKYFHPLMPSQLRSIVVASRERKLEYYTSRKLTEAAPSVNNRSTLAKTVISPVPINTGQNEEKLSLLPRDSQLVSTQQSLQLASIFYPPTVDNLSGGFFNIIQAISDSYGWANLPREMIKKSLVSSVRQGSMLSRCSSFIGGIVHLFKGDKTSGIPVVAKLSFDAIQGLRIYSAGFVDSLKQMGAVGTRAASQMVQGFRNAISTVRLVVATLSNIAQCARSQYTQIRTVTITGAAMSAAFVVGAGEYLLALAALNPIGATIVIGAVLIGGSCLVYRSLQS